MKHPFVIASIIAVLTAATHQPIQAQTASPVSGSPEANKALIRSFYDKVLNASDPSAVDSLVSTDYQYGSGIPTGLAAYKQYLAAFQKAVPNYTTYIQDMIAEGDWVAVRSFDTGTQQDVLNKVPATGKDFSVQTADLYRIANGQLIAHIGIFDNLGVFEQLGVVKAPQLSVIPPVQATTATL